MRSKKHRQPIQNVSAKGLIQIRLQKTREMNKKIPFIVGMDLALGTNRKQAANSQSRRSRDKESEGPKFFNALSQTASGGKE